MTGQQSAGELPAAAAFVPSNSDGQKYRRLTYRTEPHCLALGRWVLFCFSSLFAGLFLLLLLFCVMLVMMIANLKSAPKTHYVNMCVLVLQSRKWPFLYAVSVGWGLCGFGGGWCDFQSGPWTLWDSESRSTKQYDPGLRSCCLPELHAMETGGKTYSVHRLSGQWLCRIPARFSLSRMKHNEENCRENLHDFVCNVSKCSHKFESWYVLTRWFFNFFFILLGSGNGEKLDSCRRYCPVNCTFHIEQLI